MTLLRIGSSNTPVAVEYQDVSRAMMRCQRRVFTFDAKPYRDETIARARDLWLFRMESEHRSASVFSALCNQMMLAGATIDMEGIALRMAQDELRHAEVCGEVVRALGGEPVVEVAEPIAPVAVHPGASPEERALRNVIYGCCMSETVNAARFVEAIDSMSDPLLRDVTRQLLSDETLHAQFGFHYLEAWASWLEGKPEVREGLTRYLHYAFAVLERDLSGQRMPETELDADEIALGMPDGRRTREVFYTTVEGAIVPGLERFGIDAREAWEKRAFDPPPAG